MSFRIKLFRLFKDASYEMAAKEIRALLSDEEAAGVDAITVASNELEDKEVRGRYTKHCSKYHYNELKKSYYKNPKFYLDNKDKLFGGVS